MTLRRQIFALTLTSKGWDPSYLLRKALGGDNRIADYKFRTVGPTVSLPSPNRERLIALAAWVAGEQAKKDLGLPSEWDQRNWLTRTDCGTACCIAGKIALDDGGVPVDRSPGGWDGDWTAAEPGRATARVKFPGENRVVRIEDYAREALGLTEDQTSRLFAGSNDLPAVLAVIRDILAEDDDPSAASTRRLNSAFQRDDEPATPVRARRRRLGVTGHGHGPECDICYEDVPDSEITEPAT